LAENFLLMLQNEVALTAALLSDSKSDAQSQSMSVTLSLDNVTVSMSNVTSKGSITQVVQNAGGKILFFQQIGDTIQSDYSSTIVPKTN